MMKRIACILVLGLLLSGCGGSKESASSTMTQAATQQLVSYTHISLEDTGVYRLEDKQSDPFVTLKGDQFHFCVDDNNALSFGFPMSGWILYWDEESGYLTCQPSDEQRYATELILMKKLEKDYSGMTQEAIAEDVSSGMDTLAAGQLGTGVAMNKLEPFTVPAGTCLEMTGTLLGEGNQLLNVDTVALISGQSVYFFMTISSSDQFAQMQQAAATILTNFEPIQSQS